MKKVLILLVSLFAVLMIGCPSKPQSSENAANTKSTENPLANTNWQVESYGAADNQQSVKRDTTNGTGFAATIEFTAANVGGRIAGCNIISFNYTAQGSKITTKPVSTTAMACSDEIMKQERELNEAFEKSETFRLDGDKLEISYDNGKIIRLKRIK